MKEKTSITLVHVTTVPKSLGFIKGQPGFMRKRGVDTIAISSNGPYLEKFGLQEQIKTIPIELSRTISPARDLVSLYRLWKQFRLLKPDIVHAHTPKAGLLSMLAAAFAGVPVRIYNLHGLPLLTATDWKKWILTLTERISCRMASQVISVSKSLEKIFIREGYCPENKIQTLLQGSINGINATQQFFRSPEIVKRGLEFRERLGLTAEIPAIGFLGRIVRDKGIIELEQAWQKVKAVSPNARLIIAGDPEPFNPVPPAVMKSLEADPNILIVGYQHDTAAFFTAIDMLVLPTYREGFPTVVMEAAAMELPVVASNAIGCVDAIVDEVTGLLVPVQDSEKLAEAILRYLANPELRQQHGQAGRQRMLKDYAPQKIHEAIYAEYLRLLNQSGISLCETHDISSRLAS